MVCIVPDCARPPTWAMSDPGARRQEVATQCVVREFRLLSQATQQRVLGMAIRNSRLSYGIAPHDGRYLRGHRR